MTTNSFFNNDQRLRQNRYFSDEFKKRRVKELENNLVSICEICKTYQVSRPSVYKWIYKFSAMAKSQNKQVVEPKSDSRKIQLLEQRIRELERIVGQKQILLEFKDKMIEIAEQTYDVDIKKKLGSKLSAGINYLEDKSTST
jgi:transposase-like protein